MKSCPGLIAAGAVAGLIAACAGPIHHLKNEAILPEIDVVAVKENSDEALRIAQEAKLDVEMVNTKLTEIDNRLVLLSEEVASVSIAKIEEMETRIALLIEALKDLQKQLTALEVSPAVRATPSPKKDCGKEKSETSSATFAITSPEYASYQTALRTFNARNYQEAAVLFREIAEQYPNGKYADDCLYWIGECAYAQGKYAEAIAQYQKILTLNGSAKADDAIFKIGKAYLAMGQSGQAKEFWNKLAVQYPASEYAPRAKQYLTEVK